MDGRVNCGYVRGRVPPGCLEDSFPRVEQQTVAAGPWRCRRISVGGDLGETTRRSLQAHSCLSWCRATPTKKLGTCSGTAAAPPPQPEPGQAEEIASTLTPDMKILAQTWRWVLGGHDFRGCGKTPGAEVSKGHGLIALIDPEQGRPVSKTFLRLLPALDRAVPAATIPDAG